MTHQISAEHLTVQKIAEIIEGHHTLKLSADAVKRITHCREYLDKKIAESEKPIYGVTTGFGSLCKISISNDQLSQLQINLMMSHACGVGERVPNDIVKIMLLLKVQSLSYGFSGVKLDTVERLIDLFNNDVYPVVYKQGSVGASGDLVPLAHLCLPIVGLGEVEYKGELMSGAELSKKMGWEPVKLGSKEGLALLNGTQNMSAHAVWALIKAERLSKWADVIAAISLEAYDGRIEPFTHAVHAVRPHQGQIETAARMRELLDGSELIKQPKVNVQDPYSFRCIPQVHGSVKDTIRYVGSVIDTEINSATDNPTVCPNEDLIISAGNFHGEPIAMPMDFLCIAMAELSNISERRTYKLVSGTRDLRFHDSAVHRRSHRQPEQDAVYAFVGRHHPHLTGPGRPREHGRQCRREVVQGGREHRARAGHRTVQRRPGAGVPPSIEVIGPAGARCGRLPQGCPLHQRGPAHVSAHCQVSRVLAE